MTDKPSIYRSGTIVLVRNEQPVRVGEHNLGYTRGSTWATLRLSDLEVMAIEDKAGPGWMSQHLKGKKAQLIMRELHALARELGIKPDPWHPADPANAGHKLMALWRWCFANQDAVIHVYMED